MKILLITNSIDKKYGWSRYGFELLNSGVFVPDRGVVCVHEKGQVPENFIEKSILFSPSLYMRFPALARYSAYRLQQIIDEVKPDVLHILVEPYLLLLPHIKIPKDVRCLATFHGTYADELFVHSKISVVAKKAVKLLDEIICVSSYTKNVLKKHVRKESIVIPNGLHLKKTKVTKKNKKKTHVFVHIGSISERKGILEALRGFYAFQERYPSLKWKFYIIGGTVGDAAYSTKVRKEIETLNLTKRVVIKGFITEKEKISILQKASGLVMLSKKVGSAFEGFGLSYIEANAYGVPVIGPNVGGPVEVITNGVNGYAVSVTDPIAVAEALHNITLGNIKKSDCLATARKFSAKEMGKSTRNAYRKSA